MTKRAALSKAMFLSGAALVSDLLVKGHEVQLLQFEPPLKSCTCFCSKLSTRSVLPLSHPVEFLIYSALLTSVPYRHCFRHSSTSPSQHLCPGNLKPLGFMSLEEVIKRKLLRAHQLTYKQVNRKAPYTCPVLDVHFAYYSHTSSYIKDAAGRIGVVETIWTYMCNGTPLRPVHKHLRFWQGVWKTIPLVAPKISLIG